MLGVLGALLDERASEAAAMLGCRGITRAHRCEAPHTGQATAASAPFGARPPPLAFLNCESIPSDMRYP